MNYGEKRKVLITFFRTIISIRSFGKKVRKVTKIGQKGLRKAKAIVRCEMTSFTNESLRTEYE